MVHLGQMRALVVLILWASFFFFLYIHFFIGSSSVKVLHSISSSEQGIGEVVWMQRSGQQGSSKETRRVGNVPQYLWGSSLPKNLNKTCAKFPTFDDIHFNNANWQMQRLNNVTVYLFNAYLDARVLNEFAPEVRITLIADNVEGMQESCARTFCHLWYQNESAPIIVKARECRPIWVDAWGKNSHYVGRLMACPLPAERKDLVPDSVSLVPEECENATNNLYIHYDTPEAGEAGNKIGVCVKGLDFPDDGEKPYKLIEWIELLGLMGADTIFLYEFATHPDAKRVLDYYEGKGKVQVSPLTFPGTLPNEPELRHRFMEDRKRHLTEKRKNEVITYNDCLYRNLYRYEYLALLDTDEIMLPIAAPTWRELLERPSVKYDAEKYPVVSYVFRQSHFFNDLEKEEIPETYYMLRHVFREFNYTRPGAAVKCLHRTDRAQTLHNHFPFSCLGNCKRHNFDPDEDGVMQHYRTTTKLSDYMNGTEGKTCLDGRELGYCINYYAKEDTRIWRFKEELISRVDKALKEIGPLGQQD